MLGLLASCDTTDTVLQTQFIRKEIALQERPRPVETRDIKWTVVNQDTVDSFVSDAKARGEFAYFILSTDDYSKLLLNLSDIRRYVEQQREIIVYYEEAIKNDEDTTEKDSNTGSR